MPPTGRAADPETGSVLPSDRRISGRTPRSHPHETFAGSDDLFLASPLFTPIILHLDRDINRDINRDVKRGGNQKSGIREIRIGNDVMIGHYTRSLPRKPTSPGAGRTLVLSSWVSPAPRRSSNITGAWRLFMLSPAT